MTCRSDWRRPPTWLAAAREHLDDDHASATARAWARQHTRRIGREIRRRLRVGGRRGDSKECAGGCDALGAVGGGKEPVVADAVSAISDCTVLHGTATSDA